MADGTAGQGVDAGYCTRRLSRNWTATAGGTATRQEKGECSLRLTFIRSGTILAGSYLLFQSVLYCPVPQSSCDSTWPVTNRNGRLTWPVLRLVEVVNFHLFFVDSEKNKCCAC